MPNYKKTKTACYLGFITQAIAANFAPLLFLKFHRDYGISLGNIASISANPVMGLIGCILCGFSVGIVWPGTISISSKTFPTGGTAMFALLAMAGDLGGSIGPAIVGRVTQFAGDNIRVGMRIGLIFPTVLILMLIIISISAAKTEKNSV